MNQRFEQIYTANREAVRAYVRRRAPDAVVDDVVSETFLVCLRRIDQVPHEALPWLYAVAWKTLANERRKQARAAPSDALPVGAPAPVGGQRLRPHHRVVGPGPAPRRRGGALRRSRA